MDRPPTPSEAALAANKSNRKNFFTISGAAVSRRQAGLPDSWRTTAGWLGGGPAAPPVAPPPEPPPKPRKFPDIPILEDYSAEAGDDFWAAFPSNPLPKSAQTAVRADKLRLLVKRYGKKWSSAKKRVARRAIKNLERGACPAMKKDLPAMSAENAGTALLSGTEVTDTIADWVQQGFVAGPFKEPPLKNFRCNPIMAIIQPGKIRPVMNLSAPKGRSYNDAIDELQLPKLQMATARDFAATAAAAGRGARMSKMDLKDAYKHVPCHPSLWASQGFKWCGRYFVDLTTVFGSKAAPADFDCLGATLGELAKTISRLPANAFHRTLDDTTIVCPAGDAAGRRFARAYRRICAFINIPMAAEDPAKEKAFTDSTDGTVLGIHFDTIRGRWSMPPKRAADTAQLIEIFTAGTAVQLQQVQQLLGNLEALAQMAPFTRGFKWNILALLRSFGGDEETIRAVPQQVRADLAIWKNFLTAGTAGLPIAKPITDPPVGCLHFVSDAAGRPPPGAKGAVGAASLGTVDSGVWFGTTIRWEVPLLWAADARSAVYEMLGLLLPIVTIPGRLRHRHIILHVDNISIVWAWKKRHMKNDELASILIRALHILEAALPCRIYVHHLPRISTPAAAAADRLSRDSTATAADFRLLTHPNPTLPKAFLSWLKKPLSNWNLGIEIAAEINKYF